jgi:beta-N-acetylhexosaminidase
MKKINRVCLTLLAFLMLGCATSSSTSTKVISLTEEELEIATLIKNLTLRQRIGQRMIGWIPKDGLTDEIQSLITSGEIGGFILYPWNYTSLAETIELTTRLQSWVSESPPGIPLFLTADQEGGRVAAFRFDEFVQFPSAFNLAVRNSEELIRSASYVNGLQLKSIGINMNLAPVLDLYPKPDSSIIGDRSFGADEERTSLFGKAYVEGALKSGVIPVLKHFPGHGLSSVDSHGNLPVIENLSSEELRRHLMPFKEAIDAGAPAIMTAHLLFPDIDEDYPVTLSEPFIVDLLRDELGFTGMIISDGLAMGALAKNYTLDETIARCFEVGIDVILVHSQYNIPELIDKVEAMVMDGRISNRQINEGLFRVLTAKKDAGILRFPD